jgi:hypothetical protein
MKRDGDHSLTTTMLLESNLEDVVEPLCQICCHGRAPGAALAGTIRRFELRWGIPARRPLPTQLCHDGNSPRCWSSINGGAAIGELMLPTFGGGAE